MAFVWTEEMSLSIEKWAKSEEGKKEIVKIFSELPSKRAKKTARDWEEFRKKLQTPYTI